MFIYIYIYISTVYTRIFWCWVVARYDQTFASRQFALYKFSEVKGSRDFKGLNVSMMLAKGRLDYGYGMLWGILSHADLQISTGRPNDGENRAAPPEWSHTQVLAMAGAVGQAELSRVPRKTPHLGGPRAGWVVAMRCLGASLSPKSSGLSLVLVVFHLAVLVILLVGFDSLEIIWGSFRFGFRFWVLNPGSVLLVLNSKTAGLFYWSFFNIPVLRFRSGSCSVTWNSKCWSFASKRKPNTFLNTCSLCQTCSKKFKEPMFDLTYSSILTVASQCGFYMFFFFTVMYKITTYYNSSYMKL